LTPEFPVVNVTNCHSDMLLLREISFANQVAEYSRSPDVASVTNLRQPCG